ncbi:MAG: RNA methyltransferase [Xanthomonadales bacterium]|nr:RNA methyltransferase [Xanthomonadales bacterium]
MNSKAAQDSRTADPVAGSLARMRIVLVETTHPGNIGATARAMKVMGLSRLHLVQPLHFPHADATARASGADDILKHATVHDSLESALGGCSLVLGTSARLRSLSMPQFDVREAAGQALDEPGEADVAILFGRERHGLTNEQIQRCHRLVHIETNPEYGSLNIAQAVQLMAYELRMAALGLEGKALPPTDWQPVDAGQMELFYQHLEQTLLEIEFLNPAQPKKLMMRLRRLFNRARPDQNEINILRGILAAAQRARRGRSD